MRAIGCRRLPGRFSAPIAHSGRIAHERRVEIGNLQRPDVGITGDQRKNWHPGTHVSDLQKVARSCPFGLADADIADDYFWSEREEFCARNFADRHRRPELLRELALRDAAEHSDRKGAETNDDEGGKHGAGRQCDAQPRPEGPSPGRWRSHGGGRSGARFRRAPVTERPAQPNCAGRR